MGWVWVWVLITQRLAGSRCLYKMQKQPPEVFCKKRCSYSQENNCARAPFYKVAGLRPVTLLKKKLLHRCFPVNFAKFLRTFFSQNTSGRLLLKMYVPEFIRKSFDERTDPNRIRECHYGFLFLIKCNYTSN